MSNNRTGQTFKLYPALPEDEPLRYPLPLCKDLVPAVFSHPARQESLYEPRCMAVGWKGLLNDLITIHPE